MSFDSTVHAKAVELTKLGYEMCATAGSGHPTSGASLAHLVTVLMYQHMRWEPANPSHVSSDRLVLSEGHAVPIVYAAAADMGLRTASAHVDICHPHVVVVLRQAVPAAERAMAQDPAGRQRLEQLEAEAFEAVRDHLEAVVSGILGLGIVRSRLSMDLTLGDVILTFVMENDPPGRDNSYT